MPLESPIHPGKIVWTGENPGIFLKEDPKGPLSALALFFRIFYSPAGRGTALLFFEAPNVEQSLPEVVNVMLTDNRPMAEYLMQSFIGKLPALTGQAAFNAVQYVNIIESYSGGDPRSSYCEVVKAKGIDVELVWDDLGSPIALELPAELTGAKENELYSLLVESRKPRIILNGKQLKGQPFERMQAGIKTTTAFLYFSETWIAPPE